MIRQNRTSKHSTRRTVSPATSFVDAGAIDAQAVAGIFLISPFAESIDRFPFAVAILKSPLIALFHVRATKLVTKRFDMR